MNRRRQTEQGQAIIEFALIMPIIILLFLGVIYFAMAFNLQIVLNAAAREGARAWASNRADTSPCTATDTVTCDPTLGNNGFHKNVYPMVKKYIKDNGYDPDNHLVIEKVQLFLEDKTLEEWNQISDSAEDATKVKLTLTYFYDLPGANLKFTTIPLTATYTAKRGS